MIITGVEPLGHVLVKDVTVVDNIVGVAHGLAEPGTLTGVVQEIVKGGNDVSKRSRKGHGEIVVVKGEGLV